MDEQTCISVQHVKKKLANALIKCKSLSSKGTRGSPKSWGLISRGF
jgi:hypothetical protein